MGDGGAKKEAKRAREEEAAREARVKSGTEGIRKQFARAFDDHYYKEFSKAADDFYRPQINKQYEDSLKNLQYALARSGLSQSSAHEDQLDRLNLEKGTAEGQVAQNIQNMKNARKSDVANQETIATQQLINTADPAAASAQAAGLIKSQTEMPGWQPLGQVFTDASSFLANQANAERDGNARYNMGVSKWGDNTRRYLQNVSR